MGTEASKATLGTIGNYNLIAKIAEGGMGWVYKGQQKDTGQVVAIKIVPATMTKNEVLLKRFSNEFQAASAIDHPNIVRAIEYCGTGATPFLVMEFVDGESLGEKLEREKKIPEAEAIRLIAQVCQGLHRAHKMGLIHRDVKPDNILLTRAGDAKLTDLGLVKDLDAEMNLTKTGRGLGTPHFMAPEQFRNAKNADARCDIYSVGATLYMMVTGELPFGKTSGPLDAWMKKVNNELAAPRKICPELSERADWAIRRAMSSDPNLRPASCREFVEDLTGHSTRKITTPADTAAQQGQDLWYLVYKDDEGTMHTVKGSTEGIRRSLKEKLLGDASNVRACRNKTGPFEALKALPEFRDLVETGSSGNVLVTPKSNSSSHNIPPRSGSGSTPVAGAALQVPAESSSRNSGPIPHIHLDAGNSDGSNWLMTLGLALLGSVSALIALYFFMHFKK